MAEDKKPTAAAPKPAPAPKPAAKTIDPEKKKAREEIKKAGEKFLLMIKELEQAAAKDQA